MLGPILNSGGRLGYSDYATRLLSSNSESEVSKISSKLIYLNENWQDEYGGFLEIWDKKMKNKVHSISPLFNRCVIFNTDSTTYHGHPEPLKVKNGVFRRVLNLYYYTSDRPKNEKFDPHFTNYNLNRYLGRY